VSRQDNSDPLPFVQVDRAVDPSSTLLAGHMKVSPQHALGSLIGFWKLCGDPRELERIVESTPTGAEPAVVLSAEDVALRFQLASDHRVEPVVLARLGILEELPSGFRVRGMSRFFDTIEARLQARKAAALGGKASAASRKASTGSAQPRSAVGSRAAQADVEALPKRSRSDAEADAEAPSKPDRSLEGRGQRAEALKEGPNGSAPQLELVSQKPKTRPPPKLPNPEAEFERFASALTPDEAAVFEAYETHMGVRLGAAWDLRKFVAGKLKSHHAAELCAAIKGHAADQWRRENQPSLRAILRDATVIAMSAKAGAA
jgi:hypothetical protein